MRSVAAQGRSRCDVRRPRGPGLAHAALALVGLIAVATLALTSRSTPPPTIAEFAPQAVERITDEAGDAAAAGSAASADMSPGAGSASSPDASPYAIDVARVRQCVGEPPRQIEDPQSPPCVPYWSGDNGGATSRGVTRDEIRVVDPMHSGAISEALAAFFNRRFELYGRRLRLIRRTVPEGAEGERAAARAVYEQDQAFASLGFVRWNMDYFDELARLGIVAVHRSPVFPETYLASRRPYVWSYHMANDRIFATAGNWFCSRLAGRNAAHAGDPLLRATRRKPGVVLTSAGWEGTSAEPMKTQLRACGEPADAVIETSERFRSDQSDNGEYAVFMENAMLQMKSSGVTSVFCLCDEGHTGIAMHAATNQGYFPEWVLTNYIANTGVAALHGWGPPEQMSSLMFIAQQPMERPRSEHPSNWALQEVSDIRPPATWLEHTGLDLSYRVLLLIASGFQMAGPHLTPESFERGLHRARFPNPAHPIMAGAVGFADGDHTMTDDVAEMWWSNTAPNPYDEGAGAFCYIDHGARRRLGTFPDDDPFFSGPCDSGSTGAR